MYRTIIIIAMSLAALSVTGGSALAGQSDEGTDATESRRDPRHRGRDFDGPGFLAARAAEHLDLDEAQSADLQNILTAAKPEFDVLKKRGRDTMEALMALDPEDADYGAALQNLSVESGQVATDLILLHGRVRAEVHALLTPEQRATLAEKLSMFREKGWRGPRRGAR
jgi:Spy/CpxP family protein refolding chaperone